MSNAWHFVAEDMEATADTHKSIASLLVEEIVKPLKMFAEAQHRTRKSVESLLDKGRRSVQRSALCFYLWRNQRVKKLQFYLVLLDAKCKNVFESHNLCCIGCDILQAMP